jgi:glyoxylase-like metal-dependent hydrolase (beta-lactamase superfamily II)
MRVIDVEHLGRPNVIGCWEVDGALIDPGPESSLETLLAALDGEQPAAIVLTHIHLDHAAATGAIVRRWPETPVYVHELGAPHLIDPSRLLASAERLYGDAMERLWGEIVPVPEQNVRALAGGETVLGLRVAYTPGHASHHVCYLHEETGTAFVGDVAAVLIPATNLVVPPTPPPDIDIETWLESIEAVEAWKPERLAITHFGAIDSPAEHLATVRGRLAEEAQLARELDEAKYEKRHRALVALRADTEEAAEELIQCVPPQYQWRGLDRYWRKRAEAGTRPRGGGCPGGPAASPKGASPCVAGICNSREGGASARSSAPDSRRSAGIAVQPHRRGSCLRRKARMSGDPPRSAATRASGPGLSPVPRRSPLRRRASTAPGIRRHCRRCSIDRATFPPR